MTHLSKTLMSWNYYITHPQQQQQKVKSIVNIKNGDGLNVFRLQMADTDYMRTYADLMKAETRGKYKYVK